MEHKNIDKLEKLEILTKEVMNVVKHVHLFFYTYINRELHLLLVKDKNSSFFSEIHTELMPADNVAPYAISRALCSTYKGLFRASNFAKFKAKDKLLHEDYSHKELFHAYEFWLQPDYHEWLDKLSGEPVIQYDSISGTMIYFIEFPEVDIDAVNLNLTEIEFPFELTYVNYKKQEFEKFKLASKSIMLLKHFDFDHFISESQTNILNDNLEYYVVLAIKPKDQSKSDQAGFFHFPALFQGLYRKNNEKWVYCVCSVQLPDEALLKKCKRIIIPGSHISTYHDLPFIKEAEVWIKELYQNKSFSHVKILGICFGEQLIMQALGSTVQKMERDFVRYPELLEIDDSFWELGFVKSSKVEKCKNLVIPQAHGDEVVNIPEGTNIRNYAQSESCKNEFLVSDDERLFLIQGHPEYRPEFNLARMAPFFVQRQGKEKSHENIMEALEDLRKNYLTREVTSVDLRKLCFAFLKH